MNRGIYLSVSELDEEDLINTAKAISESYNTNSINLNNNYNSLFNSFKLQISEEFNYKDVYKKIQKNVLKINDKENKDC
jgi:hypothetical protein